MTLRFLLPLLAVSTVGGCFDKSPPAGILDVDTFARVYVDLVENEEMLSRWTTYNLKKFDPDSTFIRLGTSRDKFEKTVEYFNEDLSRWKDFYSAVIALQEGKGKTQPEP